MTIDKIENHPDVNNYESENKTLSSAFVTTVFNGADVLERAVLSGLEQTCPIDEYIIVDDGSTDSTWQVVKKMAALDNRVRCFALGRVGRGAALNFAIGHTNCELILIQDADDYSLPNRVCETIKAFRCEPNLGVLAAGYLAVDMEKRVESVRVPAHAHEEILSRLSGCVPICHTVAAFRKAAWVDVGGYPEAFRGIIDMPFWLSIASTSWRFRGCYSIFGVHHYYRASNFHSMFRQRSRAFLLFKYNLLAFFQIRMSISNLAKGFGRFFTVIFLPSQLRWHLRGLLLRYRIFSVKRPKTDRRCGQ